MQTALNKTLLLPSLKQHIVFLFACLAATCQLSAQVAQPPSLTAADKAVQAYQLATGYAMRLYNGSEYIRTYPNVAGHPFLSADSMQRGAIAYDGVVYPDVLLNYDIVRDAVIIKGLQVFALRLVQDKIDSFTIAGRRLLLFADNNGHKLPKGFYEILYNGKAQVLAKRTKQITAPSREDELSRFTVAASYFVLRSGILYQVSDKSNLVKAFSDQKEAIQKQVQQSGFNFRKAPEELLIEIATFYDQIQR